jgi:hypothetical protein
MPMKTFSKIIRGKLCNPLNSLPPPEQLKAINIDNTSDIKPAVKVNAVIGSALPRIGPYKKLDNSKQVVALIDDVGEDPISTN